MQHVTEPLVPPGLLLDSGGSSQCCWPTRQGPVEAVLWSQVMLLADVSTAQTQHNWCHHWKPRQEAEGSPEAVAPACPWDLFLPSPTPKEPDPHWSSTAEGIHLADSSTRTH